MFQTSGSMKRRSSRLAAPFTQSDRAATGDDPARGLDLVHGQIRRMICTGGRVTQGLGESRWWPGSDRPGVRPTAAGLSSRCRTQLAMALSVVSPPAMNSSPIKALIRSSIIDSPSVSACVSREDQIVARVAAAALRSPGGCTPGTPSASPHPHSWMSGSRVRFDRNAISEEYQFVEDQHVLARRVEHSRRPR